MLLLVIAFALGLDCLLSLFSVPPAFHLLSHAMVVLFASIQDGIKERAIVTPLTFMSVAYSVIVMIPIAMFRFDAPNGLLAPTSATLTYGSWYYLLFFGVLAQTYRVCTSRSTRGAETRDPLIVPLGWVLSLCAGSWALHMLLIVLIGHVNLFLYALNPLFYFKEVRYSNLNWAMFVKEAFYGLFCAAFALDLEVRRPRRLIGVCLVFIAAYSLTSGYKHSWFEPLLAVVIVKGFALRKPVGRFAVLASVLLVIGIPVGFWWRDNVNANEMVDTMIGYDEAFYFGSRTISEMKPKSEYLAEGFEGLLITPIPRALWPGKPESYGLTNDVLSTEMQGVDALESVRSFPTMGLAEAWIAMGPAGIVLSGMAVGFLLGLSSRMIRSSRLGIVLCGIAFCVKCYPILRVGILDTLDYSFLFMYVIAALLIDPLARLSSSAARGRPAPTRSEDPGKHALA